MPVSLVSLCGQRVTLLYGTASTTIVKVLGDSAVVRGRNTVWFTVAQLGERACLRVHHNSIIHSELRELGRMCGMSPPTHLLKALLAWLHVFICWFFVCAVECRKCLQLKNLRGSDIQTESHLEPFKDRASNTWDSVIKASPSRDAWQTNCRLAILGWGCPARPLRRHIPKSSISWGANQSHVVQSCCVNLIPMCRLLYPVYTQSNVDYILPNRALPSCCLLDISFQGRNIHIIQSDTEEHTLSVKFLFCLPTL